MIDRSVTGVMQAFAYPPLAASGGRQADMGGRLWRTLGTASLVVVCLFVGARWLLFPSHDLLQGQGSRLSLDSKGKACPFRNVAFKLGSTYSSQNTVRGLLESYKLNMPCFPEFHIVVPDGDLEPFTKLVQELAVPNVVMHPERMPKLIASSEKMHRVQWADYWVDNYTSADYIAFLDSDTLFTHPATCQSMFDAQGRPYFFYWTYHNVWFTESSVGLLRKALLNQPVKYESWYTHEEVESMKNFDYMAYFPVILPRKLLPLMREIIMDALPSVNFDEAYVRYDGPSQFDLMGKIAHIFMKDQVRTVPVQPTDRDLSLATVSNFSISRHHILPLVHVSWPHSTEPNGIVQPIVDESPEFWEVSKRMAKSALCIRKHYAPSLNQFSPDNIFLDLLDENERNCDSPTLLHPSQFVYPSLKQDLEASSEYYLKSQKGRGLCTDPWPKQELERLAIDQKLSHPK